MRIYLDLDSRLILSTPNRPIRTLEFKRRDNDSLELQFVRSGIVVPVSSGTTVQYGLKPVDQYGAGFFSVGSFVKTGSGEAALFTASVNLNTVPIAQAFDLEPKSISAMLEIEARDGDTVNSSITLPVTLHNDVIRGDEATPAAIPDGKATQTEAQEGTDNTKWMTPLRTKQAITQAASSYAPATGIAPTAITGTAVVTADTRLSNSRTPTAHKSSHATGGADALTPADIGAVRSFVKDGTHNTDIAPMAMALGDIEVPARTALSCDGAMDTSLDTDNPWSVSFPDKFRAAIGAATSAQGAKADSSLQQGAYISAASLEVGTIATGQAPNLYVGQNGKVGIGTETPTERLEVAGKVKISHPDGELRVAADVVEYVAIKSYGIESGWNNSSLSFEEQALRSNGTVVLNWYDANISVNERTIKNLGRPEEANDAVRKTDLDLRVPVPPTSGSYALRSVNGVVSWVAA